MTANAFHRLPSWAQKRIKDLEEEVIALRTSLVDRSGMLESPISVTPPVGDPYHIAPRSEVRFDLRTAGADADPFGRRKIKVSLTEVREHGVLVPRLSIYGIENLIVLPMAANNIIVELVQP